MKKFLKILTAALVLPIAFSESAFAINKEITCPDGTPDGSKCWQCGSNCYATLTGTTMNVTGSGALDATSQLMNPLTNPIYHTSSSWGNYEIKTINIGKDITSIGNWAFEGMDSINSINFEEGSKLTSIGKSACPYANVKVVLPEGVTSLGKWAFSSATEIYCTASQMNGVCKNMSDNGMLYATGKQYEKQGDKLIVTYDGKTEIYNKNFTEQYDAKGNIIARYDENGTMRYAKDISGAEYHYDSQGTLKGVTKRGPFTIPEANALTKEGPVNTVTITW